MIKEYSSEQSQQKAISYEEAKKFASKEGDFKSKIAESYEHERFPNEPKRFLDSLNFEASEKLRSVAPNYTVIDNMKFWIRVNEQRTTFPNVLSLQNGMIDHLHDSGHLGTVKVFCNFPRCVY